MQLTPTVQPAAYQESTLHPAHKSLRPLAVNTSIFANLTLSLLVTIDFQLGFFGQLRASSCFGFLPWDSATEPNPSTKEHSLNAGQFFSFLRIT
jgi:hypothetical protein